MTRTSQSLAAALAAACAALGIAACGGSSKQASQPGKSSSSPGALSAEAKSLATGDIPDNQAFLTYSNSAAGYSIKYPEGWSQHGSAGNVTFQDKNNLVHIVVGSGAPPTAASVRAELAKLRGSNSTLRATTPQAIKLSGAQAIKAVYTTQSAPNPVTGKRVTLMVDRYGLASKGKRAVVDLGTPKGVDNVDAYRMMIESFKWK